MGDAFTVGLLLGGFLLASWVDMRLGHSRPELPVKRICHAVVAVVLLNVSAGGLALVHSTDPSQALFLLALFGIFLPALVYALLSGLWVLRLLAEIARVPR